MAQGDGKIGTVDILITDESESVQRFKKQLREIRRPGTDGDDYLVLGKQARSFRVVAFRDEATKSAAKNTESLLDSYVGTKQTYRDENEDDWVDVLVIDQKTLRLRLPLSTGLYAAAGEAHGLFVKLVLKLTKLNPIQ